MAKKKQKKKMFYKLCNLFSLMHNFILGSLGSLHGVFDAYVSSIIMPAMLLIGLYGIIIHYEVLMTSLLVSLCRWDLNAVQYFILQCFLSSHFALAVLVVSVGFSDLLIYYITGNLPVHYPFLVDSLVDSLESPLINSSNLIIDQRFDCAGVDVVDGVPKKTEVTTLEEKSSKDVMNFTAYEALKISALLLVAIYLAQGV